MPVKIPYSLFHSFFDCHKKVKENVAVSERPGAHARFVPSFRVQGLNWSIKIQQRPRCLSLSVFFSKAKERRIEGVSRDLARTSTAPRGLGTES